MQNITLNPKLPSLNPNPKETWHQGFSGIRLRFFLVVLEREISYSNTSLKAFGVQGLGSSHRLKLREGFAALTRAFALCLGVDGQSKLMSPEIDNPKTSEPDIRHLHGPVSFPGQVLPMNPRIREEQQTRQAFIA